MNILLLRMLLNTRYVPMPLGLLSVGTIIERCGYKPKLVDVYIDSSKSLEEVFEIIKDFNPSIIGFGGITNCYIRTRKLSHAIKERYPDIMQIAGGPLSSVSGLLLNNTKVEAVFHGEAEVSFPIFLEKFSRGELFHDTPGISYLSDGKVMRNAPAQQIADLDTIPYPAYHLVDVHKYVHPVKDILNAFGPGLKNNPLYADILEQVKGRKNLFTVFTSRGCTHKCSFCYRHVIGIRQQSVDYVIKHLKFLKETYHVDGFDFCDELFNSRPDWVMEFCDALERENLDIVYRVLGARADRVNKAMLQRLKATGCFIINYGQESGSDTILNEIKKGITAKMNKEVTLLTQKMGIHNTVQLVIGSPSETTDTIWETIRFLKEVNALQISLNYMMPFPETPIWKYVEEKGLVKDLEAYLERVVAFPGDPLINLTKAPDKEWKRWSSIIRKELKLHHHRKKHPVIYLLYSLFLNFEYRFIHLIPKRVKEFINKMLGLLNPSTWQYRE